MSSTCRYTPSTGAAWYHVDLHPDFDESDLRTDFTHWVALIQQSARARWWQARRLRHTADAVSRRWHADPHLFMIWNDLLRTYFQWSSDPTSMDTAFRCQIHQQITDTACALHPITGPWLWRNRLQLFELTGHGRAADVHTFIDRRKAANLDRFHCYDPEPIWQGFLDYQRLLTHAGWVDGKARNSLLNWADRIRESWERHPDEAARISWSALCEIYAYWLTYPEDAAHAHDPVALLRPGQAHGPTRWLWNARVRTHLGHQPHPEVPVTVLPGSPDAARFNAYAPVPAFASREA